MTGKDFYKKIMTEYGFDNENTKEKIRRAAKYDVLKSPVKRFASSKFFSFATAAAVFVSVAGGYAYLSNQYNTRDTKPTGGNVYNLTKEQRVEKMNASLDELKNDATGEKNAKIIDIVINFENYMTSEEFDEIISSFDNGTGEIQVVTLYLGETSVNGSVVLGAQKIIGAKVRAAAKYMVIFADSNMFLEVNNADIYEGSEYKPILPDNEPSISIDTLPPVRTDTVESETTHTATSNVITTAATPSTKPNQLSPEQFDDITNNAAVKEFTVGNVTSKLVLSKEKVVLYKLLETGSYEEISSHTVHSPSVITKSVENSSVIEILIADSNALTTGGEITGSQTESSSADETTAPASANVLRFSDFNEQIVPTRFFVVTANGIQKVRLTNEFSNFAFSYNNADGGKTTKIFSTKNWRLISLPDEIKNSDIVFNDETHFTATVKNESVMTVTNYEITSENTIIKSSTQTETSTSSSTSSSSQTPHASIVTTTTEASSAINSESAAPSTTTMTSSTKLESSTGSNTVAKS